MRKTAIAIATVAAILATLVPFGAQATHCDIFMFTGYNHPAGSLGPNTGAAGCLRESANVSTGVVLPGADYVQAAVLKSVSEAQPGTATISFLKGSTVVASFTRAFALNAEGTRWQTTTVTIPTSRDFTAVRASASVGGNARSTTYTFTA